MIYKSKILYFVCAAGLVLSINAANAQSIGSFATRPLMNSNVPPPPPNTIEMPQSKAIVETATPVSAPVLFPPAPVVMFRQTNFRAPEQEIYYGTNPNYNDELQPMISAPMSTMENDTPRAIAPNMVNVTPLTAAQQNRKRRFWQPLELPATPAPSILEPAKGLYRDITLDTNSPIDPKRGPMTAIVQDSSRALRRDVPQAFADILPWVDNTRKQEPFESVLARVSDNLSRANSSDPEWANPAQSEIRELATRLDRLSSPPQYVAEYQAPVAASKSADIRASRPFYTRPIWPGAHPNSESQLRPIAIVSTTEDESGARTTGQNLAFAASSLEAPEAQKPKPQPTRTRRRR